MCNSKLFQDCRPSVKKNYSLDEFNELVASDPAYQKAMRDAEEQKREKLERLKAIEVPFFNYLQERGFAVCSFGELNTYRPYDQDLTAILLKWVNISTSEDLLWPILVLLRNTKGKFDGYALADLLTQSDSPRVRDYAAITISESKCKIDPIWLLGSVNNPALGDARYQLLPAVAKQCPQALARKAIKDVFDVQPWLAARALAICGTIDDVTFLGDREQHPSRDVRKEIAKAIGKIKKRN
jgi:hypothetical protein